MEAPKSEIKEIKDKSINKNTLRIKYKNTDKNNKKIKLFYSPFVNKNADNFIMIYNNKKYKLKEELSIEKNEKEEIEIILKAKNNNFSMFWMFNDCTSLISVQGFRN